MDGPHSFDDFRGIIEELRRGCPWDKAQTLSSLKPSLFGEMAETAAGVSLCEKTGNGENLCEELGDLLMVLMLMSRIAEEDGLFSIDDVIESASRKMICRHPHVFGTGFVDENGDLVRGWKEIKRLEKAGKSQEELKGQEDAVKDAVKELAAYYSRETEGQETETEIS